MKSKLLLMLLTGLILTGCKSEIDKCADAVVANGNTEAAGRIACLKAASGKD